MTIGRMQTAKGFATMFAIAAMPFFAVLGSGQSQAYEDNDEQALRLRDTVADPSVPLAWDRRYHPETWRYKSYKSSCGKKRYWNGYKCVLKRRYR
ncbi:MAG: hypothetical protein KDJ17_02645 [Hyphomicrobiaceae bacterium]|nr:hypothetical protein [Hyphomicrobiaceae bacterium]